MKRCCATCKSYCPIKHRGQKHSRGVCEKQYAARITDGFEIKLNISLPEEFVCDLYEENPQPVYAIVDGERYLIPPVVANDLIEKGWARVSVEDGKIIIHKKGDEQ